MRGRLTAAGPANAAVPQQVCHLHLNAAALCCVLIVSRRLVSCVFTLADAVPERPASSFGARERVQAPVAVEAGTGVGAGAGAGAAGDGAGAGPGLTAPAATPAAATAVLANAALAASSTLSWPALGLEPWLHSACTAMGLRKPTPVQAAVIPPILANRDVIACSYTGSGKVRGWRCLRPPPRCCCSLLSLSLSQTAAFALPLLSKLSEDPYGIFAVVLTPGRELAHQIGEQFLALGAPMRARVCVLTGGVDFMRQAKDLAQLPHVLVATPGRLAALISSSGAPPRLGSVACLVLDEADRLMDPSIAPDMVRRRGFARVWQQP